MNKLENFGPVYLINLKEDGHRLNSAIQQFKEYEISNYEIIEAFDGRVSDLSEIIDGKRPNLKNGEIGCMASHIKSLRHWLDTSNSEYAVIMEDDFSFDTVKYWSFDWTYFINNIPKDADIVQLIMIKNNPIKFNLHKKEILTSNNMMQYEWSTASYLIKRTYAEKIVKLHTNKDKYVFNSHGFENQAADVLLYGLGNSYSIPIFTHILDEKNSINSQNEKFHYRSKNIIDLWWKENGLKQDKEEMISLSSNISNKKSSENGCFAIFHIDGEGNAMEKRNKLVRRARQSLIETFDELNTPTIIMKDKEDVSKFYLSSSAKIDPLGHFGDGWKPGELGIWASNITAWENFLSSDYDYVILMEDDIVLNKDFDKKLIGFLNELPADWDFFTAYVPEYGNNRYDKDRANLEIGSNNICRVYQSWSCLCYVVSKKGAKKLLKYISRGIKSPIDHYLFYNQKLNGYTIKMNVRSICEIYPTSSTVQASKKINMTGSV
jgi:GR25 family glycosyltransferase involved in LPS biosynthesis